MTVRHLFFLSLVNIAAKLAFLTYCSKRKNSHLSGVTAAEPVEARVVVSLDHLCLRQAQAPALFDKITYETMRYVPISPNA